jgi:hypothetical protein
MAPHGNACCVKWRYAVLGWLTWKVGRRIARRRLLAGRR